MSIALTSPLGRLQDNQRQTSGRVSNITGKHFAAERGRLSWTASDVLACHASALQTLKIVSNCNRSR